MTFNPTLGLPLQGKQLPTLPPNATKDEQTAVINEIIDRLNTNTQEIVRTDSIFLNIDFSQVEQVFVVPHELGYKPRVFAYMNGVTVGLQDGSLAYENVDIPLPTYLSSAVPGSGGSNPVPVVFYTWLDVFIDATNVYFHHRSGNLNLPPLALPVTYYLTRQPTG